MRYSSKEDSPQECSVVKECAFNIIIDDLDALEMIAPDSRAARMFMSKLIQSLNTNQQHVCSSSSSGNNRLETVAAVDDSTSSNKNYNGTGSDVDVDSAQNSNKKSINNENSINNINRNLESSTLSPSNRILTIAAYGRESNSSSSSESESQLNSFFPSAVYVSYLSSSRSNYEPTLSEYCRYR